MDKQKPSFIKRVFKKKRTWIILGVVVIFVGYIIFKPTNNSKNVVSDFAKYVDLEQTILSTGQVTSKTDLNLSFNSSGIVRSAEESLRRKKPPTEH